MTMKKITIRIAIMTFICLGIAGSSISQQVKRNLEKPKFAATKLKSMQNDTNHFTIYPGQVGVQSKTHKKSPENVNDVLDSLFKYSINFGSQKIIYTYDANGNQLIWLQQQWVINKWTNAKRIVKTFDANGNNLTETGQLWQNNAWKNDHVLNRTFNTSSNLMHIVRQVWINSSWVNDAQSDYTYNVNGNKLTERMQLWDSTSVAWINSTFDTCAYDGIGNQLVFIEKGWDGTSWVNSIYDSCTYNANGKLLYKLEQNWDGTAWSNSSEDIHTYDIDNNELTELMNQNWDGANWGWRGLYTYTYDGNDNMLSWIQQSWDSGNSIWLNWSRYDFTYDANGNELTYIDWESYDNITWTESLNEACTYNSDNNLLSSIYQFQCGSGNCVNGWNAEYIYQPGLITANGNTWSGTEWLPGDAGNIFIVFHDLGTFMNFFPDPDNNIYNLVQVLAYYSTVTTGINEQVADAAGLISVCPNPANDEINIIPSNAKIKIKEFQIFDPSGKEQQITFTNNHADISNLQSGLYFIRLTTFDGQVVMKKIIKL